MVNQSLQQPPPLLKLLASEVRWTLVTSLAKGDLRVQELADLTHEPMNLVSYHLKQLRDHKIVRIRQSEADRRDAFYSVNLGELRSLYQNAGINLHPAIGIDYLSVLRQTLRPARILFVCTHNSARSQMAEGLMRDMTGGQIDVFSAGNEPTVLHPDAIRTMEAQGVDIRGQQPKSLQEFEGQTFDYVITVCDIARETCPTFLGAAVNIHWGFADPTTIENIEDRRWAFEQIAEQLKLRIESFLVTLSQKPKLQ